VREERGTDTERTDNDFWQQQTDDTTITTVKIAKRVLLHGIEMTNTHTHRLLQTVLWCACMHIHTCATQ